MRIITVKQPWAWAIVHGGKDIENRVRNLAGNYRGPVAIHAGLGWAEGSYDDWEIRRAIRSEDQGYPADDGETWASDTIEDEDQRFAIRGAIIGVVDLIGVHAAGDSKYDGEFSAGNFGRRCSPWAQPDVWHLELENPRPLAEPIPYKGALGMRTLPDDVERQVMAGVAA